jgi:ATP-dependent DNA ligase
MQPTLVARPVHPHGWVYQERCDGWRMLASKRDRQVRLVSRAGRDHTRRSPALAARDLRDRELHARRDQLEKLLDGKEVLRRRGGWPTPPDAVGAGVGRGYEGLWSRRARPRPPAAGGRSPGSR